MCYVVGQGRLRQLEPVWPFRKALAAYTGVADECRPDVLLYDAVLLPVLGEEGKIPMNGLCTVESTSTKRCGNCHTLSASPSISAYAVVMVCFSNNLSAAMSGGGSNNTTLLHSVLEKQFPADGVWQEREMGKHTCEKCGADAAVLQHKWCYPLPPLLIVDLAGIFENKKLAQCVTAGILYESTKHVFGGDQEYRRVAYILGNNSHFVVLYHDVTDFQDDSHHNVNAGDIGIGTTSDSAVNGKGRKRHQFLLYDGMVEDIKVMTPEQVEVYMRERHMSVSYLLFIRKEYIHSSSPSATATAIASPPSMVKSVVCDSSAPTPQQHESSARTANAAIASHSSSPAGSSIYKVDADVSLNGIVKTLLDVRMLPLSSESLVAPDVALEKLHSKVEEHRRRNDPTLLTWKDTTEVFPLRELPRISRKQLEKFPWFPFIQEQLKLRPNQFAKGRNVAMLLEELHKHESDGGDDGDDGDEESSDVDDHNNNTSNVTASAGAALSGGMCQNVLWAIRLVVQWCMDKAVPDVMGGGWVNYAGKVESLSVERIAQLGCFSVMISSVEKLSRFFLWLQNSKGFKNAQTMRGLVSALCHVMKWEMWRSQENGMDPTLRERLKVAFEHLKEHRRVFSKEGNLYRRHKRDQIELERIGRWATLEQLSKVFQRADQVIDAFIKKAHKMQVQLKMLPDYQQRQVQHKFQFTVQEALLFQRCFLWKLTGLWAQQRTTVLTKMSEGTSFTFDEVLKAWLYEPGREKNSIARTFVKDGRRLWIPPSLTPLVQFLRKYIRPVLLAQRKPNQRPVKYRDVYDFVVSKRAGSKSEVKKKLGTQASKFYDSALLLNSKGHPLTADEIRRGYYMDTFCVIGVVLRPVDVRRIMCSYFYSSEGQKQFGYEVKRLTYLLDHHPNTCREYYAALTTQDMPPHARERPAFLQHAVTCSTTKKSPAPSKSMCFSPIR